MSVSERRRAELVAALQTRAKAPAPPAWREIEGRVRHALEDWRRTLLSDVAHARDAFRQLLAGPIFFTPFEAEGRRGLRFQGRIGLEPLLGAVGATYVVTRVGIEPTTL